jgi:hypothetical protein
MNKYINIVLCFVFLNAPLLFPQFYYFGRNKVQFNSFDWKVLKTEHFDVYYYNEMKEIASIGGRFAEDAYSDYKEKLNTIVTRRIPLIFYNTSNQFQETNTTEGFIPEGVGGFFEFLKGRVVIPYTGSLSDFNHVIKHELAHVFMMNKLYNLMADHHLSGDLQPPLWFTEGFAEYMSSRQDDQAEMILRDGILNNYFTGLKNINQVYGTFLMYKYGQSFLEFVKEKYGEEKIQQMLDNFWLFPNFDHTIEYTLGNKIERIDEEWTYYIKQKYFPLMGERKPVKLAAEKLTTEGYSFTPVPYCGSSGKYVFFQANRDGYSSIYKLKLDSANKYPVELVLRGEKSNDFEAFHLLYTSIDISKNGIMAFAAKSGASDALYLFSAAGNKIIKKIQRDYLISISSPKFSGGQNELVFSAVDQKGFSDIFIYSTEKDSVIRLTNDYYDDKEPVFASNDENVIFSSDRSDGGLQGAHNLFVYNLNSHSIKYLTSLKAKCSSPYYSKQGNYILFTADIDSVNNIWKLSLDNRENKIEKVTNFITNVYNPVLLDSSIVLFSAFEESYFSLYKYRMPADSLCKTVTMNYNFPGKKWYADGISEEGNRQPLKYEKEYTLDYAQSQVSTDPVYGTQGGAILSLSDLLGNDNYFFLIYNTAEVQSDILKSFNVVVQRVDLSSRSNYGYGIFHFSGRRYDLQDPDEYYYERSFGGFFSLNFPLDKFQRIETTISVSNSDKQVVTGIIERKALLVTNSIAYVMDNSLWSQSGPIDGIRARFLLGFTSDIKYSNVNYYTVMADYRQYFRLALRSAFALRAAFFVNHGKEARRYFMGGSWDLRGWPRWSIRGEKMWISSAELRFPLIDQIRVKLPFVDLGFFGIRGALFADAGNAWDDEYDETLGSIGGGIRFNFFNAIVFRYDIGKKIENNFNNLQHGLFYQFFFGYDF